MKYLLLGLGVIVPRIVLVLGWLLGIFNSVPMPCCLIPLVAIVFLPYTLLAYTFAYVISGGIGVFWLLIIAGAFVIDLSAIRTLCGKM